MKLGGLRFGPRVRALADVAAAPTSAVRRGVVPGGGEPAVGFGKHHGTVPVSHRALAAVRLVVRELPRVGTEQGVERVHQRAR